MTPIRQAGAVRQFTVAPDDDGVRLDRWFKRHLPQVGFATVSRWARTGQVRVDGKRAKPEDRLAAGQVVRVPPGGDLPRGTRPKRELTPGQIAQAEAMVIHRTDGNMLEVPVTCRLDTAEEVAIYEAGGVLQRFAQDFLKSAKAA